MGKNRYYLYSKELDKFVGMNGKDFSLTLVNEVKQAKNFQRKQAAQVFQNRINSQNLVRVVIVKKY